jgi:hypothetical protein
MKKEYQCKVENLKHYFYAYNELVKDKNILFTHIKRSEN